MTMAKAFSVLLALAWISLFVLSATSHQSTPSLILPDKYFTEYSTDGDHFLPLAADQRFSARDSDLSLRMQIPEDYPFAYRMHMQLDHIAASVFVNGTLVRETGLPGGGTDQSICGRTWLHLDEWDLSPGDTLTVTLHNPHPAGANADAYNTFLDHVYVANEVRLNARLSSLYAPVHWLGMAELALALIILSVGMSARLMGVRQTGAPLYAALAIFCHGALLALWNPVNLDLSFTFVTSATQMCRMFMTLSALMLCAEELGGRGGQALRRMAAGLGALTALLLVLSMLQRVLLYDAMALFRAALLPCCAAALGCTLRALLGRMGAASTRAKLAVLSLVMAAQMLDAVNAWFGWWRDGTASLCMVLIFEAVYLPMGLWAMASSLRAAQRSAKLEEDLRSSRITLAMSQIRTHFIFNVLNAISGLCKFAPDQADAAVVSFARYLRGNIDAMAEDRTVSFESELMRTENYVALEQIRFGDRISLRKEIGVSGFYLPPLILQPIVENAIRHGLLKKPGGGCVTLRTMRVDGAVRIEVEDDGAGFDPLQPRSDGHRSVALDNIRFRLEHMVGGRIDIRSSPGKGTLVTLIIPEKEAFR